MTSTMPRTLSHVALISALIRSAVSFSFTYGKATECGDLQVSWTGGTAPFQLLIIPAFDVPVNITIPSDAYSNGKGTFTTQLARPQNSTLLLTMSDATGFNTGGTTNLITVGQSTGGSCNTTASHTAFSYTTDSALIQCREYTFGHFNNATQPVTIYGFIPGGDVFILRPPVGSPIGYDWTANVTAGTSIIFAMVDAQGRQGGAADLRTVGQSDASDCLGSTSPSTTSNAPSSTATATSSTGANKPDGKPNTAVIVGVVLGLIIATACIGSLVLFFWRRRRASREWSPYPNRQSRVNPPVDLLQHPRPSASATGLAPGYAGGGLQRTISPFDDPPSHLPPGHEPEPFMLTAPSHAPYTDEEEDSPATSATSQTPGHRTRASLTSTNASAAARRKAAMAGTPSYQAPSRFILHTDIEEVQPDENGVVELPPQYSEGRRPMDALPPPPSAAAGPSQPFPPSPSDSLAPDPFRTPLSSRHPSDASRSFPPHSP